MRQSAGAAAVSAAVIGLVITACREEPTAPQAESTLEGIGARQFSFTGGSGTLLGITESAELVLIDLDADSISLLGEIPPFAGNEFGWRDIAFDGAGNLFAVREELGTSCSGVRCTYLYTLNPETGSVLQQIGSTGQYRIEAIDFGGDSLFGTGQGVPFTPSNLFVLDPATAGGEAVPDDSASFGVNPFDSQSRTISAGGFAVHPGTGDLWGVENVGTSSRSVLYRIDRTTGVADSILRIGLNGTPVFFPFSGLHILGDGTFIGVTQGPESEDYPVWEISSIPDPQSGLAEIAPIPLAIDTALAGIGSELFGLERGPSQPPSLSLTADTTELHPWTPQLTVNSRLQDSISGGITSLSVSTIVGGVPANVSVEVWAEFLTGGGGHAHQSARVRYDEIPLATDSFPNRRPFFYGLVGNPWTGFFRYNSAEHASFQATTTSGELDFAFQAGAIGGEADLIAQMEVLGVLYADTVRVQIRVPDLIDGRTVGGVSGVYWVGGTTAHPQGSNWFMTSPVAAEMQVIIDSMAVRDAGAGFYLQHNDASLPFGGAFTGDPASLLAISGTSETIDHPLMAHTSHALGIDVDLGWCYTTTTEFHSTVPQPARIQGTNCSATKPVSFTRLREFAARQGGCAAIHNSNHYHIRFAGDCPE